MIYELHRPAHEELNETYPALFLLHGMGSNEQDMLSLVNGLEERFYIFSIRGPLTQPPGFAFFTIQGFGNPHQDRFDEAVAKLTNFIEYAKGQYPLDKDSLFLLGFSQGAILSMSTGLLLGSQKIKGIVALSGYIPTFVKEQYKIQPVQDLSLFISHGEMDQVLPYQWGVDNNEFFQKLGANVSFHAYREGHTVSLENYQDFTKWLLEAVQKGGKKR
jgi:phospholipase/carboxylesterase